MEGISTRSDTLPLQKIGLQTAMSTHHIKTMQTNPCTEL